MPWDTIGHDWAKQMLARAAAGRPSHAYLFTGPAQIGKRDAHGNEEAVNLVELVAVGGIDRLGAEDPPRKHQAQRRLVRHHRPRSTTRE